MKIAVFGADGFIGRNVLSVLKEKHEVVGIARKTSDKHDFIQADLLDKNSIERALSSISPEVVINCAGIVDNSDASQQNITFTKNLLEVIYDKKIELKLVIISGSAAEYGLVKESDIPVPETAQLNANAGYGLSKLMEERFALDYGKEHDLPIVVARIFNPIGKGMHSRFLIPKLISQVKEVEERKRGEIEVSRLDSKRDYINIKDVARAIAVLAEQIPKNKVYNIGSGTSTSNGDLIRIVINELGLKDQPKIVETATEKEPLIAIQADIRRIRAEYSWQPENTIEETVKEIIHGA